MEHKAIFTVDQKEIDKLMRLARRTCWALIVLDYLTLRLIHSRIQVQLDRVAELTGEAVADCIEIVYDDNK